MNNPYVVNITLAAKFASRAASSSNKHCVDLRNHILRIGEKDKHGANLCCVVAGSSDAHYNKCLDLALKVWKERFGTSKQDLLKEDQTPFTTIVLCKLSASSSFQPLAAARFGLCETNATRTAKIYSLASYNDGMHHGSILLRKIAELAADEQCQFMTVDVSRPKITEEHEIMRFLVDKSEAAFWRLEKPNPYQKHSYIDSSIRTERVERQLKFYRKNGFVFCIAPDASAADERQTLWGRVDPYYAYTLVTELSKVPLQNTQRLTVWTTPSDLQNNNNQYLKQGNKPRS